MCQKAQKFAARREIDNFSEKLGKNPKAQTRLQPLAEKISSFHVKYGFVYISYLRAAFWRKSWNQNKRRPRKITNNNKRSETKQTITKEEDCCDLLCDQNGDRNEVADEAHGPHDGEEDALGPILDVYPGQKFGTGQSAAIQLLLNQSLGNVDGLFEGLRNPEVSGQVHGGELTCEPRGLYCAIESRPLSQPLIREAAAASEAALLERFFFDERCSRRTFLRDSYYVCYIN